MTNQVPGLPPPGWYDDPEGRPGLRWWDGSQWTEDRAPSGPPGATGTGGPRDDGMRNVGDWLSETFRIAKERAGHLFTMVVAFSLPIGLLSAFAVWRFFQSLTVDFDDGIIDSPAAGDWVLMGVSLLLVALVSLTMAAGMQRQTMAAYIGKPEPWNKSLVEGLSKVPALFGNYLLVGVGFVVVIVAIFALALISPVLLVFAFLGLIPLILWMVPRLALLTPAATCGPPGSGLALTKAFRLTKGVAWALFGRLMLLGLVAIGIGLAGSVINAPFAPTFDPATIDSDTNVIDFSDFVGDNFALLGISQVISTMLNAITSALSAAGMSIIYKDRGGVIDPELGYEPATEA